MFWPLDDIPAARISAAADLGAHILMSTIEPRDETAGQPPRDPHAQGVPAADVDDLRSRVRGPILLAGDQGLAVEVAPWNLTVRHTPAVVVGATSAEDVSAAVSWAAGQGLKVGVQATGHGVLPDVAGQMLITTHRMQGVIIDPDLRSARVEAGVKWARVLKESSDHGLAPLSGSSSDVGVVGYTLGGGLGLLSRAHGFAADHVTAVEIVTADGTLRRISAESDSGLFWAVRGGKGYFGIVTAIEFGLFPAEGLIGGPIFFAGADASALLKTYRQWAMTVPDDVNSSIAVLRLPPIEEVPAPLRGQTVIHLRYVYSGSDTAEADRLLAPMRTAGTILIDAVRPLRPEEFDSVHMDPTDPLPAWEKGLLLAELTDDTIDAFLAVAGPDVDVPLLLVEMRQLGGALARAPRVPNAVPGRHAAWAVQIGALLMPDNADAVVAAGLAVHAALAPWRAPGNLINFLGLVSGREEVAEAYSPAVVERLRAVKREVDPDGLFTIAPAI